MYSPPASSLAHQSKQRLEVSFTLAPGREQRVLTTGCRGPLLYRVAHGTQARWTGRDEARRGGRTKKQNKTRRGILVNNTLARAPPFFFLSLFFGRTTSLQCQLKCPHTSKTCVISIGLIKSCNWTRCAKCKQISCISILYVCLNNSPT